MGLSRCHAQSLFVPKVCHYPAGVFPAPKIAICDILRWTSGLCSVSRKGLKQVESIKSEKLLGSGGAACASVCWGLAVGTRRGVGELHDLVDSAALFRSVSLYDWGYSMDDTGAVSCIACTLDNSAFAVGWKLRGLTVWSITGCRLMSTICQIGLSSASSPVVKANQDCKYEPMMSGTSLMHWDEYGYRLYAAEERSSERIIAFFWANFA